MTVTDTRTDASQVSSANPAEQLLLPSLAIQGFRGFRDLEVSRLGRLTLFTGANSIGKSTILDAVRIWAQRGSRASIRSLLTRRNEFSTNVDLDGEPYIDVDLNALFYGREISIGSSITIGSTFETPELEIVAEEITDEHDRLLGRFGYEAIADGKGILVAKFADRKHPLPWIILPNGDIVDTRGEWYPRWRRPRMDSDPNVEEDDTVFSAIGPDLPDDRTLANRWFGVALTDAETTVVEALRLIAGDDIERIAALGEDRKNRSKEDIGIFVRRHGSDQRIPLKSLGDGAVRMLAIALALANRHMGFLLLDEVENGIHYRVLPDMWRLIFELARKNDVQVLATTHSYDCVRGFAQAALENEEVEGRLVQLSSRNGKTYVGELPEKELVIAARQRIEVRG